MNDSHETAFAVFCLCCGNLYMRKVTSYQAARALVDREACSACNKQLRRLLFEAFALDVDTWFTVNRLEPYG